MSLYKLHIDKTVKPIITMFLPHGRDQCKTCTYSIRNKITQTKKKKKTTENKTTTTKNRCKTLDTIILRE